MSKLGFADVPWVVRGTSWATAMMAWILFEEFIIDRHAWDRWLPFYRVGNLCVYDLAVAILLSGAFLLLNRTKPR